MHFLQEPNILRSMKNQGYEVIWIGRNDIIPANRSKTEYCDEFYSGSDFVNHRDDADLKFSPGPQVSCKTRCLQNWLTFRLHGQIWQDLN